MANIARTIARDVYFRPVVKGALRFGFSGRDRKIMQKYLKENAVRKLQIGAGYNLRPDWLNTNWFPVRFTQSNCIFMDATKRFPYPDAVFDYVFTEHMIEHIPYLSGQAILRECLRVLKPGGRLRISTPDLAFLVNLLKPDLQPLQREYISEAGAMLPDGVPRTPVTIVNNFVRDWGHQFIYDKETLTACLAAAGFTNINPYEVNQSDDPVLAGIDNAKRMPDGFVELESMVFEAERPSSVVS